MGPKIKSYTGLLLQTFELVCKTYQRDPRQSDVMVKFSRSSEIQVISYDAFTELTSTFAIGYRVLSGSWRIDVFMYEYNAWIMKVSYIMSEHIDNGEHWYDLSTMIHKENYLKWVKDQTVHQIIEHELDRSRNRHYKERRIKCSKKMIGRRIGV